MKKPLRILTVITILASSMLFTQPASAISMGDPYNSTTGDGDATCSNSGGFFTVEDYVVVSSYQCSGLVYIPIGITAIGDSAFLETNATYFIFPSTLQTIGMDAFFEAHALTELVIPDGVTSIGPYAFGGIPTLTNVVIGNGVTSIGDAAFQGDSGITNLVLGNNVTYIGDAAFNGLRALTTLKIPNGVIYIGGSAFANDLNDPSALSTLVIPESVTTLGSNAFGGADVLTHFSYCGTLGDEDFSIAGFRINSIIDPQSYSCDTAPGVPTDVSVNITSDHSADVAFNPPVSDGGQPITSYLAVANPGNISAGLFQAGGGHIQFNDLTPGTSYTFSVYANNIIGESAPVSVTAITNGACMSGADQTGVFNISSNNAVVNSTQGCSGSVVIPAGVTSIANNAFKNRPGITSVVIADSVTSIGTSAFYGNTNLTSLVIGNGVTSIGTSAFSDASSLNSLTIGNSVTSIGNSAFANSALISVTIPDSVTSIQSNAFFYTPSLSSVTFGNSVTSIGSGAFQYAGLTSLTIPDSVTSLGNSAFESLPSDLTTFTYCGNSLDSQTLFESGATRFGQRTQVCPSNLAAPGAPTIGTATATGTTTATVDFTAPSSDGGSAILSYTATSTPGSITATITQAGSGTISITGLTPATSYTFEITALNQVGASVSSSASNSITTDTPITAPSAPGAVVATATGKRSATVSFGTPASDGGSAVTSYTATSTPGGITQTLTQAGSGVFTFDNLQPGTAYTFAVTATNAIGTSSATTSNSITTVALDVASISTLSFTDNGKGTGGKLTWNGRNIESVLYNGPANSYPGSYSFGTFSSSWNGKIRNLTPSTSYTISIHVISGDGFGVSKSLTFTTAAEKNEVKDLNYWKAWVVENTFTPGEAASMTRLLTNFDALKPPSRLSYITVPKSRVLTVSAKSLTPDSCSIISPTAKVNAGLVTALTKDTCTISYTVSGRSKAPVTLVKDFVFKKVAK
ncbi:unannotated protein [freshwater metagenome]|uniref:Unannotated protein n=1 Tax=freshwater metagenome TaxID=449393 RepID=A0A6J6GSP9_9ZZZZ|nr:leucine-rich repeat protein [Actinomycetota bacterium]